MLVTHFCRSSDCLADKQSCQNGFIYIYTLILTLLKRSSYLEKPVNNAKRMTAKEITYSDFVNIGKPQMNDKLLFASNVLCLVAVTLYAF